MKRIARLSRSFAGRFKHTKPHTEHIFEYNIDPYNSVHIKPQNIPETKDQFTEKLTNSLVHWENNKVKGVWISIPKKNSDLISLAVKEGFNFHHVRKDSLVLSKWLPKDSASRLPGMATHYGGVGGVCIREDKNQILLIKEKNGPGKGKNQQKKFFLVLKNFKKINFYLILGRWKIPGGLVDMGELIGEAACREVLEETNIQSKCLGLLGFTEFKHSRFGRNDLYFVCLLEPTSFDIKHCEIEIADACWMDVDEYCRIPTPYKVDEKLKKIIKFYNDARIDPKMDVSQMLDEGGLKNIILLEGQKHEFNVGRKIVYNVNYPYYLRYFKKP